ncbi:MAG: hypothetical protein AMJ79_03020 [Phycisphaerae bacterium SM23_30]|nr:MAG: hypothetical protein AMJ79_03020 [Phycisphaerae bacterium SM23_30]
MNPVGFFLIALGLFGLAGAAFNWNWFMQSRKARFLTTMMGRSGARVFYMLLGAFIVTMGILILVGAIQLK